MPPGRRVAGGQAYAQCRNGQTFFTDLKHVTKRKISIISIGFRLNTHTWPPVTISTAYANQRIFTRIMGDVCEVVHRQDPEGTY